MNSKQRRQVRRARYKLNRKGKCGRLACGKELEEVAFRCSQTGLVFCKDCGLWGRAGPKYRLRKETLFEALARINVPAS